MKTNLVKILALSAMVLSIGACQQQGQGQSSGQSGSSQTSDSSGTDSQSQIVDAGVVEMGQVLSLDGDNQWELLGKKLTVEHLVVQGKYGNTIIGGAALGEYISDLRGLQIDCVELPTFEVGSGWGADINATGILADVDGRAVLTEATIEVVSERVYNDERTSYTGGLPVYMWPSKYMQREYFDELMGRNMSGLYLQGTFQIASLPEEVSPTQGTTFYCTFPGEYLDVEDPDNYSLITVQVPVGLSEAACQAFNTYFAAKQVRDFFVFEGTGQYGAQANLGYGLLVDSWAAQSFVDPAEPPVVITEWADVAADVNEYYLDPILNLGNDAKVFNYKYKVYNNTDLDDLFDSQEYIYITDKDNTLFTDMMFYCKPADMEDVFEGLEGVIKTAGFEEKLKEEGAAIYTLKDASNNVVAQFDLFITDLYVEIYYFAQPLVTVFENFAGVKALYEHRAGKFVSGFASELVDVTPAGASYELDFGSETFLYEKYQDEIYIYDIIVSFETLPADVEDDYAAALEVAGFTGKRLADYGVDGLFNATSNEFVAEISADADKKELTVEVFVLSDDAVDDYIVEIPNTVNLATALGQANAAIPADIAAITGAASTYQVSFAAALESLDSTVEGYIFDGSNGQAYAEYYASFGLITQYSIEVQLTGETYSAYVTGLVSALTTAGFAAGTFTLFNIQGYFNATTNEFVRPVATAADTVIIQLFVLDATSAARVTLAD